MTKHFGPPKYAMIAGTEMILKEDVYYRDAGQWEIGFKVDKLGRYFTVKDELEHLSEVPITKITEAEWRAGNDGYV